jgi:hypothetical protein
MSSNKTTIVDEAAQYDDWFELYNSGGSAIDVQSYYLSDNLSNLTKWEVEASVIIPAGGFGIFWADEDQSQGDTHTNFKLSASGETIYLSSPSGVLLDSLQLPEMQDDFSYGRVSDGSATLSNFSTSSPNDTNANGISRVSEIEFSISGGVYNSSVTVTLSTNTSGATIRYTTDGSEPTSSSSVYSTAITISDVNTIRARGFKTGFEESLTTTESYLVGVSHTLPIITLNTAPDNLWDDQIGIHVAGTNGIIANCTSTPKNWNQPWERPVNVQFYDENGSLGFNIDAGISIAGGCSRNNTQKGLNIETKSLYPSENIPYQLFPTRDQHEFRRFKLRAGGNDWGLSALRDAATHRFVENEVDIDLQSVRPVIVYLNDEYWGLMNIRDVHSEHSINYKHPKVDKDSLNIFKAAIYTPVNIFDFPLAEGQADDFLALYNYLASNDLSIQSHYDYVESKIDINEFINYQLLNIFVANTDWPSNNLDIWHEQGGKARWLCYDTDFGMGRQQNGSNPRTANPPNFNAITAATQQVQTGWPNDKSATLILKKLLDNSDFRNEFIQRYASQLSILFTPSRTTGIVNDLRNTMAPEMQGQLSKYNLNGGSLVNWHADVDVVVNWLNQRTSHAYTNIQNFFGTGGTYDLSIPVTTSTNGRVLLNENEYLAPLNYTGTYFDGIPLLLTAVANPGYRFSHWLETGNTNARIHVTYSTNKTLTPVFVAAEDIVINEIYYNPLGSSEDAEFIEIYNPGTYPRNLSGLVFTDGICFEFPPNTILNSGEYLLIANDASVYQGNGYQVFEWEESSLSNGGEHLQISTKSEFIIDSLSYNDGAGWAKTADNGFYSLALLDASLDNGIGSSWDVQSVYITPGAQNQFLPYDTYHLPSDIVINEIHYHPFDSITPAGDTIISKNYEFIELKNLTSTAISLDGFALTRGVTYEFPTGSVLPANGFVVLSEDSLLFHERYNFYPMGVYEGKLSNSGELIWLSDQMGNLLDAVRYDDAFPWDAQADGGTQDFSLALIDPTLPNDTYINWLHQCNSLHTPLQENEFSCFQGQTATGLTINEIHYAPTGGANLEYIELFNSSFTVLQLEGMTFSHGVTFSFGNTLMFPNSYVVIARDSATFHNTYGFAPDGDYVGALNNVGERVRLIDFFGNEIDNILYNSVDPWETVASQGAHSLALIDHTLDNSLASSWCIQNNNVTPRQTNSFGDSDGDGLIDCEDACPLLDDSLIGKACNDGDPCTTGETYNSNCGCTGGVFQDSDNDGVCDINDQCSGIDDGLIGTACDDGDPCTVGETFNANCQCSGGVYTDNDNDGICDGLDQCPGFDDSLDANNNGIPDGCDICNDYIIESNNVIISQDKSANIEISTNGRVFIGDIDYHAGQEINLTSGFEVKLGAVFHAYIAPCN